jgi:hypothetical protein
MASIISILIGKMPILVTGKPPVRKTFTKALGLAYVEAPNEACHSSHQYANSTPTPTSAIGENDQDEYDQYYGIKRKNLDPWMIEHNCP